MNKLSIKIGDGRGYYVTVETTSNNLHKVLCDNDAKTIERMIRYAVPRCNHINQRVNGVEYSVRLI